VDNYVKKRCYFCILGMIVVIFDLQQNS
jgi:hypothetical protein